MGQISCGPFDLIEPVGSGGMGEIWRARHRDEGVAVAIKVISAVRSDDPSWRERFRRELQLVSSLDHPSIVEIHDYGTASAEAASLSEGRIGVDAPWIAMEYASGGAMIGRSAPASWDETQTALTALLAALAHAHARGVVHRDVKPANVLRCTSADGRAGLRLADFGIAYAVSHSDDTGLGSLGTPLYMAPEQFTESWRSHGPWTDLYALGCVAWEWITGATPFVRSTFADVADAHMRGAVPMLQPRFPVPADVERWLRGLLEKDPRARIGHAADALTELQSVAALSWLPAVEGRGVSATIDVPTQYGTIQPTEERDEVAVALTVEMTSRLASPRPPLGEADPEHFEDDPGAGFVVRDPMPASWRPDVVETIRRPLRSAGRGVYGLRPVPFVGREAERDAIWNALRECDARRAPRVVLLRGATGVGRSRLADELGVRAAELGAATYLRLDHAETQLASDGWRGALRRFTRSGGLTRSETRRWLRRITGRRTGIDMQAVPDLAEVMVPREESDEGSSLPRLKARRAVLSRWLCRLAERRPVYLFVDDAQWAFDALQALGDVTRQAAGGNVRLLVVLAVRDDVLADHAEENAVIEALAATPDAVTLTLEPLDDDVRVELVEGLLGVTAEAAAEVVAEAAGNPLYAVQLVEHWLRAGVLVATPHGYALKPDAQTRLPDDQVERWMSLLYGALSDCEDEAVAGIERAAALGVRVDSGEWYGACQVGGARVDESAVDALVRRRLATRDPDGGWRFAHAMLCDGARLGSQMRGRHVEHHAAIARAMSGATGGPRDPRRMARHLFHAGRWEDAIAALDAAADGAHRSGDFIACLSLCRLRERALEHGGTGPDDVRWGETLSRRSRALDLLGRHSESLALVDLLDAGIEAQGWQELQGQAWARRAVSLHGLGRHVDALKWADRARAWFMSHGQLAASRPLRLERGWMLRQAGRLDEAAAEFESMLDESAPQFDGDSRMAVLTRYASVAKQRGDFARTRELLGEALTLNKQRRDRLTEATCLNGLAEVDRFEGRLDAAADGYRKAIAIYVSVGTSQVYTGRLNLALTELQRRNLDAVDAELDAIEVPVRRAGIPEYVLCAVVLRLAVAAERGEARDVRRLWADASARIEQTAMVDIDIAEPLDRAARAAAGMALGVEAAEIATAAVRQYRALGRDDRANALAALTRGGAP